ncbi:MAG: hypothetical protein ACRDNW_06055 [Trebonia sp.]
MPRQAITACPFASAAWGMLQGLGVIAAIDAAAGPRPGGQPLSTGTYLALAVGPKPAG